MGVGRAPHHCLVNVEGTRFPSEDSTQPVLTTHRGWGHWRGWQVLPLALGSCSLLATLSKDMGRPRKPSAGTIKQCRAISLSLSPPLGGFHHSNLQRAKSSARGTAGALAHLLCTEFFHDPEGTPEGCEGWHHVLHERARLQAGWRTGHSPPSCPLGLLSRTEFSYRQTSPFATSLNKSPAPKRTS